MRLRGVLAGLLCICAVSAHASAAPVPGQDYQSLQIASSTNVAALRKLYQHYTQLPYLRLEKRGGQFVLRAGFWDSTASARAALMQLVAPKGQLRTAVLRPEALLQHNWDDTAITTATAPTAAPLNAAPASTTPTPVANTDTRTTITTVAPGDTLRAFNQEDFTLAYDVLLGAGDLRRAFQIAQQAVAAVPKDRNWRRKLARVAEWTQRPDVAAEQWRSLFLLGERDQDTLDNVLRLSPQMEDPSVALQVWQIRAQRTPLNAAQWQEVLQLFEEMAQADEGSRFFEAQYQRIHDITLLDYAARLADNAGDDTRALDLYLQRSSLQPFSLDTVLRAVVLLVRSNRLPDALTLMQDHAAQVPPDAADFWRMLGQTAWDLNQADAAQNAYQHYVQTRQATLADWSRLIFLVRPKYPAQAASLALDAYRRFGSHDQLILALEIYAGLEDMQAQRRIYASLQGAALQEAEHQPRFLLQRAQFYQRSKQPDKAWADLRQALQLAPEDKDATLSALWFLIDQGRDKALAELLQHYAPLARDPAYWLAYGAANQVLGRQREALRWYAKAVQRTPQDPLLLLNYADTLEQVQQVGMAARVRRHAWLMLKQKYPAAASVPATTSNPELLSVARLALVNRPGDPALRQVSQMVQKMRGLPAEQSDSDTASLVLGWAISQEQFANARSWMWLRYARQSQEAAPLWGESQVALQLGDTSTMDRLLTHSSSAMPLYNRYDTAYALGHTDQALDMAFQGMARNDGDEALHDRFRQHAPGQAAYLQILAKKERLDTLDRQGVQTEARWPLTPQLNMLASWSRMQQSSTDSTLQSVTSDADQLEQLEGQWQGPRGPGSLAVFRRNELDSYTGMRLKQAYKWGERITLDADLAYRGDSTVSLPMQVAGYEHSLSGSLGYTLGKGTYLRAAPKLSQYYTQLGDYLGSGSALDLEAGYRIRTEYPDWHLRALWSQENFSRDGSLSIASLARLSPTLQAAIASGTIDPNSYFLPDSSNTWGLCLGMGENLAGQNLQTVYSRAWRPYFDVCLQDNSKTGNGYTALAGLAGSWTGEDHVSLELQNSDGLTTVQGPTHTLNLRYRHYF